MNDIEFSLVINNCFNKKAVILFYFILLDCEPMQAAREEP